MVYVYDYDGKGSIKKPLFTVVTAIVTIITILLITAIISVSTSKTEVSTVESDSIKFRTWEDNIPLSLPKDKVSRLSDFIHDTTQFNLDVGYGPLGVKPADFYEIAPLLKDKYDIYNPDDTCAVAFFLLESFYSRFENWDDVFVYYVYGDYILNSERSHDLKLKQNLLDYLGE